MIQVVKDGNKYMALFGANLHEGVAAFDDDKYVAVEKLRTQHPELRRVPIQFEERTLRVAYKNLSNRKLSKDVRDKNVDARASNVGVNA